MAELIEDVIRQYPILFATLNAQGNILLLERGFCADAASAPCLADDLPIQAYLGNLFDWETASSTAVRQGSWSALIERGGRKIDARLKWFVVDSVDCFTLTCATASHNEENDQQEGLATPNVNIAKALLNAEERTKRDIAREIHDHLGQKLTWCRQLVTSLKRRLHTSRQVEGVAISEDLNAIVEALADVQSTVKSLLQEIWPETLRGSGLAIALEDLTDEARRISPRTSFTLLADSSTREKRLAPLIEITCYRFCQQALTNVIQHASASKCRISLTIETRELQTSLRVAVSDNGIGLGNSVRKNARGLVGMRERATALGGRFSKRSQLGQGTELSIEIPLKDLDIK